MRSTGEHSEFDDDGWVYRQVIENYNDLHWVSYAIILGTRRRALDGSFCDSSVEDVWWAVKNARKRTYKPEPEDD